MIVITTPTGNVGRHVLRPLFEAGEPIRIIVRDAANLPDIVRSRVEIVEGSHADAEIVDRAFRGADAVFWLTPPTPQRTPEAATIDFTRPAAEAIRRHGIRHIVAATTLGRDTPWQNNAGMATASIRMIDMLRQTGAAVRGLALPGFMDNALLQVSSLRDGRMLGPIAPDKKLPHVAARDIGAVAAGFLLDRTWSGQVDVPVLGPEEHSYNDLAGIIQDVTGIRVKYTHVSFEAWYRQILDFGWPEAFASAYIQMLRAKEQGVDNAVPRASAIIGPTSFAQWVAEELAHVLTQ